MSTTQADRASALSRNADPSYIVAGGELITFKLLGETYTLFENATQPGYGGPPPHRHLRQDESFHILAGTFTFQMDGREIPAPVGAYVHVPRGTLHTFRNTGTGVGRMLVAVGPSGDFEAFVREVGEPATETTPPVVTGPPSPEIIERVVAGCRRHHIEIPPPPGTDH